MDIAIDSWELTSSLEEMTSHSWAADLPARGGGALRFPTCGMRGLAQLVSSRGVLTVEGCGTWAHTGVLILGDRCFHFTDGLGGLREGHSQSHTAVKQVANLDSDPPLGSSHCVIARS